MDRNFAIGCMRGGMCAFGLGAFGSFMLAILTYRSIFLWTCLVLESLIIPIWAMKIELEK